MFGTLIGRLSPMALPTQQPVSSPARCGDELESFPNRIITPKHFEQDQRVRRIMSVKDSTLSPILTPTSLQKLKKYLPIGTWATYTALESWAFSFRPDLPPITPLSNCNKIQRDILVSVLGLSFVSAFSSVFVKAFKYDSSAKYIIYPPPQGFTIPTRFTDPNTDVIFPCRTKNQQYFWPVFDSFGNVVYDPIQGLKVLLFKDGIRLEVGDRPVWYKSFISRLIKRPRVPSEETLSTINMIGENIARPLSHLVPYWRKSVIGVKGANYYLDFQRSSWGHAFLSLLAFGTLSLFSPQVSKCLYPTVPDYVLSIIQTGLLLFIGGITTFVMKTDDVEIARLLTQHFTTITEDEDEDIPLNLHAVVERTAWVKRVSADSIEAH